MGEPFFTAPYRLRHLYTRLARTPCSCATRATDAPGTSVASMIRRLSSALRRRCFDRLTPPVSTTARFELSIIILLGHDLRAGFIGVEQHGAVDVLDATDQNGLVIHALACERRVRAGQLLERDLA